MLEGHSAPQESSPDKCYTIRELAQEFEITLRALRFYENKGLLKPQRQGISRFYSEEDRKRLRLILKGKHLGFTLREIHELVGSQDGHAAQGPLPLSQEQCLSQITLLERQKRDIESALVELRHNYMSIYTKNAGGGDVIKL